MKFLPAYLIGLLQDTLFVLFGFLFLLPQLPTTARTIVPTSEPVYLTLPHPITHLPPGTLQFTPDLVLADPFYSPVVLHTPAFACPYLLPFV